MPIIAAYRHRVAVSDFEYDADGKGTHTVYSAGRTGLLVRIPLASPDPAESARRVFGAQFRLSPYRADPSVRCTHAVWHQTVGDYPPGSPYDFPCPRIGEE